MVEATGIVPEGRITVGCLTIEDSFHAQRFQQVIKFAHSQNVKIGIQLSHAGRKGSTIRPWDQKKLQKKLMVVGTRTLHQIFHSKTFLHLRSYPKKKLGT